MFIPPRTIARDLSRALTDVFSGAFTLVTVGVDGGNPAPVDMVNIKVLYIPAGGFLQP